MSESSAVSYFMYGRVSLPMSFPQEYFVRERLLLLIAYSVYLVTYITITHQAVYMHTCILPAAQATITALQYIIYVISIFCEFARPTVQP